ncbi:copper resistance protein CopC [Actinoplanes sp. NPDC020271]|uniref:copper resistance protein CopC n=1 Tax=Actinoplanes sp. NPDC020271 TaxID=3363896 RepID=UPI0037AB5D60
MPAASAAMPAASAAMPAASAAMPAALVASVASVASAASAASASRRAVPAPGRVVPFLIGLLLALLVPAAPVSAHTQLLGADPAKDAVLTSAPSTVTLRFSERLNPDFTTIVVSDTARQPVPAARPAVDGGAGTITLGQALVNGVYTVAYRVVSSDGHTVQGSYTFTVADPSLPAAAAPASTALPAAGTTGSGRLALIVAATAGLLLIAVAVYWYARRSARPRADAPRDGSSSRSSG